MGYQKVLLLIVLVFHMGSRAAAVSDFDNNRLKQLIFWQPERIRETGKNSLVAVIDSGVNIQKKELKALHGSGWDFINNVPVTLDDDGHGTAVSGIIKLLAPDTHILPLRVTNNGAGTKETVLEAIIYAIKLDANIINISLSVDEKTLKKAREIVGHEKFNKTIFILAAGNTHGVYSELQSQWTNVIVVAATALDEPMKLTSYSEYGAAVDIAAPAGEAHDGITTLDAFSDEPRLFNGTSAASPVVAGALALLHEKIPGADAAALKSMLLSRSYLIHAPDNAAIRMLNIEWLMNGCP
jgi:subtilisin family serine protease